MDTFMDDNKIVFEDFDWDTEAFMREDNFGEDYESIEEEEMEGETYEASNEIDGVACYADEERMFEDLGPILNDIGPLSECLFEHSNQFFELSEEETEGEEEVGFSSRMLKKTSGRLEYNSEPILKILC
ncbi:hypothetical protein LIER_10237 [Lithospermum erythrorhizon]|uniref:Uncharacterized protein n=1 Tax=Lithospermum erythrorhizon TaxID=34254 RepID=A0AAV3PIH2_LITER